MLVSMRWLARHVDLDGISPEELTRELTLSTAEVEGLAPFAPHLADVVVGSVVKRIPHPDADKLSVCQVDTGDGEEPATIVCGAPNVDAGQKVAVASVGTVLPGGVKIKKAKIRGVESRGMICSVRELELGDEHDGIWVLDPEAPLGLPVSKALDLEDWVLEIDNKSLTHRPDLWGHRGLAGEVAAIFGRELKPWTPELPATGQGTPFPVAIHSQDCPRYLALPIDGARPLPSPDWLRWLLLAVGQQPHDQLVDLSNFVMLDLGQPNHVFDRHRLAAGRIDVRSARAKERLVTLDGTECELIPADLLICSGEEPVALAGVMGGEASKVSGDTSELLLEVANFQPAVVRRTAMRLGLRSEASARFEKSLDPHLVSTATALFTQLLKELQPEVTFPSPLTDVGDWSDPACTVELRPARARALLGADIADEAMGDILGRLGFGVTRRGELLSVSVPSARATKDITAEHDLIEEIGRIHRYENVPERELAGRIVPPERDAAREMVRRIQDRLAGGARFHEVATYSFHPDDMLERIGQAELPHVQLVNPVLEALGRVRRSVLPGVLELLEHNRREREDVRLFEVGKGYRPEASQEERPGEPGEVHQLALAWVGTPPGKKARFDAARFSGLQGVIVDLLMHLGLEPPQWSPATSVPSWAHPQRALVAAWPDAQANATADRPAVLLADLEPGLARALGLSGELQSDAAAAELDLGALLSAPRRASSYKPLPRFPSTKVDVAVALASDTPAAEVEAAIRRAGKADVARVELFDLYRGPNLGEGKKSLAYHVVLQSNSRTLSDGDAQKFLGRLERQLEKLGAELRKG